MSARAGLVVSVALVVSIALAFGLSLLGSHRSDEGASGDAAGLEALRGADASGEGSIDRDETDRGGADDPLSPSGDAAPRTSPPTSDDYRCTVPALPIRREAACARGEAYPACRWWMPPEPESGDLYTFWRNTTPEHRAARPALVSLTLASVREYARRWPGERVTVGDLDAPGPRHQSHQNGVDVDLYLEHAMAVRNEPGRAPIDNYHGLSRRAVALHRARVLDLAKIVARCAGGRVLMYYADRPVVDAFRAWFTDAGLTSDLTARPMQMHNELHRFHIHLRVPEDLATLPSE